MSSLPLIPGGYDFIVAHACSLMVSLKFQIDCDSPEPHQSCINQTCYLGEGGFFRNSCILSWEFLLKESVDFCITQF